MCGANIINNIKLLLTKDFGIRVGKVYKTEARGKQRTKYKIGISDEKSIKKFFKHIGFESNEKVKKLELLIRRYKKSGMEKEDFRDLLLTTLRQNGEMSLFDLTNKLPYSELRYRLLALRNEGIVKSKVVTGNFKGVKQLYYV